MTYRWALAGLALALGASQAHASLIPLGPGSLGGQGLGSVDTVLTLTSQGNATTESGCVGAGPGGTTVLGSSKCPGNGPNGLSAFTGGDEQAINSVLSASAIGLTDFNDLRILFNASEPANGSITLGNLALTLWDSTGSILDARYIAATVPFASTDPGTGNAGFFFGLDATQAADANLVLAANPGLFIGLAANLTDAQGGLETFSIGVAETVPEPPPITVPEPMMLAIAGVGLVGVGLLRRRRPF